MRSLNPRFSSTYRFQTGPALLPFRIAFITPIALISSDRLIGPQPRVPRYEIRDPRPAL